MSEVRKVIEEYYPHIDTADVDCVQALFAEDAVYERADTSYEGILALRKFFKFFREERQIRGEHIINDMWTDEKNKNVFVTGRFEGVGAEGDARKLKFADVWRFNAANLVVRRQTYLALGNAYVRS